jgi:hypothetical protein
MRKLQVERLTFTFPAGWQAGKYDDWSFYRNQFGKQFNGIRAVDLLARGPDGTGYLIEVKDYRHPDTEKPSELPQAVADKVLMTLAALLPARLNANDPAEQALASAVLACDRVRVVAHVELPRAHMPVVDVADLKLKLAQLLRAVDAHPKVVSSVAMPGLGWHVT